MNTWIKRGLHTALLTGGLLALGAGVATADGNSIEVTAPVTVCGTGIGVLGDVTVGCTTAGGASGAMCGASGVGSVVDLTAPLTVGGPAVAVLGDATAAGSSGTAGGSGGGGSVVTLACGRRLDSAVR